MRDTTQKAHGAGNCPVIDDSKVVITNQTCGIANGSITGLQVTGDGDLTYRWTSSIGQVNIRDKNTVGQIAGRYQLHVTDMSGCTTDSREFIIAESDQLILDTKGVVKTNSACGQATGSVTGLTLTGPGPYFIEWRNSALQRISTTLDLLNQPTGQYYFTAENLNGCVRSYEVFIENSGGPVIDLSKMQVGGTDCNQENGSIKNVTATGVGNITYEWLKDGYTYSTQRNINKLKAGGYVLKVTDDSGCGPSFSKPIFLQKPQVSTIPNTMVITKASCSTFASVRNVLINGFSGYRWRDEKGNIIVEDDDLVNVSGGEYRLQIYDNCGISIITFYNLSPKIITFKNITTVVKNTCLGMATGSLSAKIDTAVRRYRWLDTHNNEVGDQPEVKNLAGGTYTLYLTDREGCERPYQTFTILESNKITIRAGNETITNDFCGTNAGSIEKVELAGGIPPYIYTWTNAAGQVVSDKADAYNLGAGTYTLSVTDENGCFTTTKDFSVGNADGVIPPPQVTNIKACSFGPLLVPVILPDSKSRYRIYDAANSLDPIAERADGKFDVNIDSDRSYYISRLVGHCESERAEVKIKVGIAASDIANTITPNGDGFNDYWKITNISSYPNAEVQVFGRGGQLVYQSRGYAKPFDGTYKGQQLPAGTYYYVVNLSSFCKLFSGNISIIR